jgi:transposase
VIGLPASVSIYLCDSPVDMRCGFDGLAAIVRNTLGLNPLSGGLFLFLGRRRDRVKILFWDRDGYVLYSKRLEKGRFPRPAVTRQAVGPPVCTLAAYEMTLLLEGIDLAGAKKRRRFILPKPAPIPV